MHITGSSRSNYEAPAPQTAPKFFFKKPENRKEETVIRLLFFKYPEPAGSFFDSKFLEYLKRSQFFDSLSFFNTQNQLILSF